MCGADERPVELPADAGTPPRAERTGERGTLAAERLLPLVYEELRALARTYFRTHRPDGVLQPTALVNEAYIKLARSTSEWTDSAHFRAVAATAMRQILRNHVRAQRAEKRGGSASREPLSRIAARSGSDAIDLADLHEALERLDRLDPDQSRLVELWYFGGLTMAQIADVFGVSERTIERRWRRARAWLHHELRGDDPT